MIIDAPPNGEAEVIRLIVIGVGLSTLSFDAWWLNCLYLLGALPILWFIRNE